MLTDILMLLEGLPICSFSVDVVRKYCTVPSQTGTVNAFNKAFRSAGVPYQMVYAGKLEYTIFDEREYGEKDVLEMGAFV